MADQDPTQEDEESGESGGGAGIFVAFRDETLAHLDELLDLQREGHQNFGRIDEASHRDNNSPEAAGDLSMGSQLKQHPLLDNQLLDGMNPDDVSASPIPTNNPEALKEYNELQLKKALKLQLQQQNQNQAKARPSTPTPRPF